MSEQTVPRVMDPKHKFNTPRNLVPIDVLKHPWEQKAPLHNRWHPDIPPVSPSGRSASSQLVHTCELSRTQVGHATVGEVFRVETADWTGGQIGNNDSAEDMKNVDLTKVHNLSGPIAISDKARPCPLCKPARDLCLTWQLCRRAGL